MNMIIEICIVAILNIAIRQQHHVNAFPSKVGCDLIGADSTLSVMERNTIMGKSPITENNLIMMKSFDATSDPSNVVITLQLNGLNRGGVVIHTSFGELNTPDTLTVKDCSTFSSSLHYQQNNVVSNFEVTLSLPKIHCSLSSLIDCIINVMSIFDNNSYILGSILSSISVHCFR